MSTSGRRFTADIVGRWDADRALFKLDDGTYKEVPVSDSLDAETMPEPGRRITAELDEAGALTSWEPAGSQ
jgi:hypothetical protein